MTLMASVASVQLWTDTNVTSLDGCMLPDWVLLILLFIGIAIVPMYDQARMLTPFEYLAGGLGTLFQSCELLDDTSW